MTQAITEYERSLEEYGRERRREGRVEGRVEVLCRLARRRFGADDGRAAGRSVRDSRGRRAARQGGIGGSRMLHSGGAAPARGGLELYSSRLKPRREGRHVRARSRWAEMHHPPAAPMACADQRLGHDLPDSGAV